MRVETVSADITAISNGTLRPGDEEDVFVTSRTEPTLKQITVFAVVSQETTNGQETESISLLVTPKQANLLLLAEVKDQIYLTQDESPDATEKTKSRVEDNRWI